MADKIETPKGGRMAMNRRIVKADELQDIEEPIIGQARIWKRPVGTGPNEPTELYVVFMETPGDQVITRGKAMPSGVDTTHVDQKLADVFRHSGVNLMDYGPAMGRSFMMDIVVSRGVAENLAKVFDPPQP